MRYMLIMDLAVFARPNRHSALQLIDIAPGVSLADIKAKTTASYTIAW